MPKARTQVLGRSIRDGKTVALSFDPSGIVHPELLVGGVRTQPTDGRTPYQEALLLTRRSNDWGSRPELSIRNPTVA